VLVVVPSERAVINTVAVINSIDEYKRSASGKARFTGRMCNKFDDFRGKPSVYEQAKLRVEQFV